MANDDQALIPSRPRFESWSRRASRLCGTYLALGGSVSFLGYVLDVPRLTDWVGNGVSIQPNAALCATLLGVFLLLRSWGATKAANAAAALVLVLAGATLFQWVTGASLGIDGLLLFGREWGRTGVVVPGRMGPPGSLSWTVLGLAALFSGMGAPAVRRLVPILALSTTVLSFTSIVSYFLQAEQLHSLPLLTVIAFQTATFLFIGSIGVLACAPERQPMQALLSGGGSGDLARRSLPLVLVVPVALGWLLVTGLDRSWFDPRFGTTLRTTIEAIVFGALLWWSVASVRAHEAAIRRGQRQVEEAAEVLRHVVERQDFLLKLADSLRRLVDPVEVERVACRMLGEYMGAERVNYAEIDAKTQEYVIRADYAAPGRDNQIGRYPVAAFGRIFRETTGSSRATVVTDVQSDPFFSPEERAALGVVETQAYVAQPIIKEGTIVAGMGVRDSKPRDWSANEVQLIEEVAERTWAAIERAKSDQAVRLADRRKDEFLAVLSHELRNPLAAIVSSLEIIHRVAAEDERLVRPREVMQRQINHLVRMVDGLLDVSRISRDKLDMRWESVDAAQALEEAVEGVAPLAKTMNHEFVVTGPTGSIYLTADHARLVQVFGNLLNNACKYTPRGGRIEVQMRRLGHWVEVEVADTGHGIPPDQLESVFEMFAQTGRPVEREHGGLGIGLHLVRKLVDLHGGSISAHSEGEGKGSRFVVRFPIVDEPAPTVPVEPGKPAR